MKQLTSTAVMFSLLAVFATHAEELDWQRTDSYVQPDFEMFFPDSAGGGKDLDALWTSRDRDTRNDEEILETVRNGLRRTRHHRTSILRWIGNKYIWGKTPQNPDAIEIMYHAADFSGKRADPYGTRHYAVYFGLSVVQPKTTAIIRALADLSMRVDDPNDLSRIAWGAKSQRNELIGCLKPYLESHDESIRAKAEVRRRIFAGELKAFVWAKQETEKRAARQYANQLPRIRKVLIEGNSQARKETLRTIQREGIASIMDDSFVSALAACGKDRDDAVRRQTARIVGTRWIWSAQSQNSEAIQLVLDLSHDDDQGVRYNAVYYGLSTVRRKSEKVVRRLLEMAFECREHNLYGRIAWGLKRDRTRVREILEEYIGGPDPARAKYARKVYEDMTGGKRSKDRPE